jgi:plastocyanin
MFPTFSAYANGYPRCLFLVGCLIFALGIVLWLHVSVFENPQGSDAQLPLDPHTLLTAPDETNKEAFAAYFAQVAELAVESDTITISGACAMDPLIINMKDNSTLKITNTDAKDHTIAFEDQNFFNVSAGQTREINIAATFGKTAGTYRYRCNDISLEANVGIMYVTH